MFGFVVADEICSGHAWCFAQEVEGRVHGEWLMRDRWTLGASMSRQSSDGQCVSMYFSIPLPGFASARNFRDDTFGDLRIKSFAACRLRLDCCLALRVTLDLIEAW